MPEVTLEEAKRAVADGRPVELYSDDDVMKLLVWIEDGDLPGDCAMIMGYASWCGFSKAAQPVVEDLAARMKGTHAIARIDADKFVKQTDGNNSKVIGGLPLNGYPTFVFAEKANAVAGDYDFDTAIVQVTRTADALQHYMDKNCGPHKSTFDAAKGVQDVQEGRVIELDTKAELTSFLTAVENDAFPGNGALIEAYASWCGHCKGLAPHYEGLAKDLAGQLPIARIDADEARVFNLGNTEIAGYPTVVYFKDNGVADGKFTEYKYDSYRTKDEIRKFVDGLRQLDSDDLPLVAEEGAAAAGGYEADWSDAGYLEADAAGDDCFEL